MAAQEQRIVSIRGAHARHACNIMLIVKENELAPSKSQPKNYLLIYRPI
jgi:hypothetical protein